MKPLSRTKRISYFAIAVALFILGIPVALFYATGHVIGTDLVLSRTGGVYIAAPYAGTKVYLGGRFQEESTIFGKGVFIEDLAPGTYTVTAGKDGFHEWSKEMQVLPGKVADGYPFMVKLSPAMVPVPEYFPASSSTPAARNPAYPAVAKLFATTTSALGAPTLVTKRDVSIWKDGNELYAEWKGSMDSIPLYFCTLGECRTLIHVITFGSEIVNADFYPGRDDTILFSARTGVFATELDTRGGQNIQAVDREPGADFRIDKEGTVYLKTSAGIVKIDI
jgi:hypothetical protein